MKAKNLTVTLVFDFRPMLAALEKLVDEITKLQEQYGAETRNDDAPSG